MGFKLTVAIPTYNRPDRIRAQVRRLLPQLREGVTIVIRDNCSDTPVQSLFSDDELDRITIVRNDINIGADANIVESIRNVETGWVWTLSDDDVITNNAIDIIIQTIHNNLDCCYINFQSKKEEITVGLDNTLEHLKIYGALGVSFFMTDCVYNIDIIKKSIYWYYIFLSTQIGQIFMIIKHLEENPNSKCFFSSMSFVEAVPKGNWSPMQLITNSSLAVDKFYYRRKDFRKSLFVALANMYLSMLIEDNNSIYANWHYYIHVIKKFGFFNLLFHNTKLLCGYWASQLLPSSIFWKLRNLCASFYNKKIRV